MENITFKQFLLTEAREDQIANSQGHKLLTIYNQKESDHKFTDALELVKFISNQTVPKYIQWTINQYLKDPSFHLQQLPEIKQLLTQYEPLANRKKIEALSKFTIETLKQALNQAAGGLTQHQFNPFALRFYEAMVKSVQEGIGTFVYQSGNFCIYVPKNHEGAANLRRANPDDVKLCTTYLDDASYYHKYARSGIQYYILTTNNLYLFFVKTRHHSPQGTEFADYENTHNIALLNPLLSSHTKEIQNIASKIIDKIPLKYAILSPSSNDKEMIEQLTDYAVAHNKINLGYIPKHMYTYQLAVSMIDAFTEVYHKLPETIITQIGHTFPQHIVIHLIRNGKLPSTTSRPTFKPELHTIFRQKFNNTPITERSQFLELLDVLVESVSDQIDKFCKENKEDENELWEEVLDSEGSIIDRPTQMVSDNFPTFTDPQDVEQWFEQNNISPRQIEEHSGFSNSFMTISRDDYNRLGLDEVSAVVYEH